MWFSLFEGTKEGKKMPPKDTELLEEIRDILLEIKQDMSEYRYVIEVDRDFAVRNIPSSEGIRTEFLQEMEFFAKFLDRIKVFINKV